MITVNINTNEISPVIDELGAVKIDKGYIIRGYNCVICQYYTVNPRSWLSTIQNTISDDGRFHKRAKLFKRDPLKLLYIIVYTASDVVFNVFTCTLMIITLNYLRNTYRQTSNSA